jgi:anti-anti-sigma regulatory factor
LFTARIDRERATIRARGRLDAVSADLLRGTVESLRRDGHAAITLDLDGITAAVPGQDGADVLTDMVEELTAVGTRIVVRRKPSWSAHPVP